MVYPGQHWERMEFWHLFMLDNAHLMMISYSYVTSIVQILDIVTQSVSVQRACLYIAIVSVSVSKLKC